MNNEENKVPENKKIQWHPGFYAAAELELHLNHKDLEFHREYNLSKKPLQIDLLIIEKLRNVQIQNEIGKLFRKYNIVEYKSPEDSLNIDDFFKTVGYAYLYKGLGEYVNQIPLEELTVSLFHETRPVKMMKEIVRYGCTIQEYAPGIYYIRGLMIPVQIVVTKELSPKLHLALKVLAKQVTGEEIRNFVEYTKIFTKTGDRMNVDAVLQVSISANKKMYDRIRRSESDMCDALRELFKDELEENYEKGMQKGEDRLKLLYAKLRQDGREGEILQSLTDPDLLQRLYKEYGM